MNKPGAVQATARTVFTKAKDARDVLTHDSARFKYLLECYVGVGVSLPSGWGAQYSKTCRRLYFYRLGASAGDSQFEWPNH